MSLLLLFTGAGIAPLPPVIELPYQGDATIYDSASATGSISGGTVLTGDTIYDSTGATGSISGGTVLPSDVSYD